MKKIIFLFIFLTSCATHRDPKLAALENEIRNMDYRLLNLAYEHNVQKCFYNYEICILRGDTKCREIKEACVIGVTNEYKKRLEIRGF